MRRILGTIICILNGLIIGRTFAKKDWFFFIVAIVLLVAFLAYEYISEDNNG